MITSQLCKWNCSIFERASKIKENSDNTCAWKKNTRCVGEEEVKTGGSKSKLERDRLKIELLHNNAQISIIIASLEASINCTKEVCRVGRLSQDQ